MQTSGGQKSKVTVTIYGQEYVVRGDEAPSHLERLAQYVDQKMKEINSKYPHLLPTKVAVLTALNLANELQKLQEEYDSLIKLIQEEKKIK